MKIVLVVLFCCCSAIDEINSADIFVIDDRSYYSSYPDLLNWHQAHRFCTYHGMYLVDVNSYFENVRALAVINQVYAKYNTSSLGFWISGTDQGSEGQFYWATTGHQFLYTYWSSGEPSNSSIHENCVLYWRDKWNDATCMNNYYFICRDTFDIPIYKNMGCDIRVRETF